MGVLLVTVLLGFEILREVDATTHDEVILVDAVLRPSGEDQQGLVNHRT